MTETVLSSATKEVVLGFDRPFVVIGERINPTGRKKLAEEMKAGDFSTVIADTTAQVEAGSTVAVFGCGLVGLGAVIGARLAGAGRIVAIDLSEERLAQARHHGATDTRVAAEDTVDWIRSETGGFGADYTFEATGNVAVMCQAVEAAREAWGLATMCGVAGKGETVDIVPRFLITGRRVTGTSFGGVKGRTQVPQLVDRWLAGEIDVESLLSHRLRLDDVNHGFELLEAQDGIRSVITFD